MPNCHKCGQSLKAESDYGRQDSCPKCMAATHACLNCVFYDTSKYNDCAEPQADRVVDKEKSNFCDYFKPTSQSGTKSAQDQKAAALKAAADLFKKK